MKTGLSTKKALFCVLILYFLCIANICQVIARQDVPEVISFAGMTLHINADARQQIAAHMDFLMTHRQSIKSNMQSLQAYLSVVSEILNKNGLPLDYQYLALQENHLLPQNVVHNTQGFWELEAAQAREIGLEINEKVDERFNLVISTELTANYLKKSNLYFKNWVFTMLALELGFQKAKTYMLGKYPRSQVIGAQNVTIDENTHPYIRKFIAQKLVFETFINPENRLQFKLIRYNQGANKTVQQIARKFQVSPEEIHQYNPWLKKKRIPTNKIYPVLIPKPSAYISTDSRKNTPSNETELSDHTWKPSPRKEPKTHFVNIYEYKTEEDLQKELLKQEEEFYKELGKSERKIPSTDPNMRSTDELPNTHTVLSGQDLFDIARLYQVTVVYLRRINNLRIEEDVFEGQMILLKPISMPGSVPLIKEQESEKNQTFREVHIVAPGEELQDIAKKYNVSVTNLRLRNHIRAGETLKVGQELIIRESPQDQSNFKSQSPDSNSESDNTLPKKHEGARLREKFLDYTPGSIRKNPDYKINPLDKLSKTKKISMFFRR
ncbi:MAG: LysM peptidoglycan-binding domain-containing protein [Microscillaceae bacterium]|nr:LysM peptidoglycan-binding domain-containing protein [Microscillaceae bacterium]